MPWMESSVTEETSALCGPRPGWGGRDNVCRDFGVSRTTGCKIFDRYKEHGQAARGDRSRRPCWLRGVTHVSGLDS